MTADRWEIWLHPLTPPVIEALRALEEAEKHWRAVAPPRITAAQAHVKLMAWSAGATVSPDPPATVEQKASAAAVSRARTNLDREIANAIGPWCPASHFQRRSA